VRLLRFAAAAADTARAPVGLTPKDAVWRRNKATLFRYRARSATRHPVPLLLVHSLISRPYILDLIPGNSFVEFLLDQGFDVYLADWGVPAAEDASLRLEDYVLDSLPGMVRAVLTTSGARALSLLGYCMGGLLTLLYAATHPQAPLRALLTLATPVDFDHLGLQRLWARHLDPDRLVGTSGNIPAALIQQSFRMLKPASEPSLARLIGLWQNLDNDRYVTQYRAFDRWTNDHIDFPGETFRQTVRDLVQGNTLVKGEFTLDGRRVDLGAIRCPFLAIAAESDHIVPLAAARPQAELVGSADAEFLVLPGGHVGLAAGRSARHVLWPRVAAWLVARSGRAAADTAATASAPAGLAAE
jgi:polyhydroxyalkanoate synthase